MSPFLRTVWIAILVQLGILFVFALGFLVSGPWLRGGLGGIAVVGMGLLMALRPLGVGSIGGALLAVLFAVSLVAVVVGILMSLARAASNVEDE